MLMVVIIIDNCCLLICKMESSEFWRGVEQFNQKEFYPCHDTLEALWMESSEPDKTFYQGILQVAVGCYHLNNNNWRGAVILLGEGTRKLSNYEPDYKEIDVTHLLDSSLSLLESLQKILPEEIDRFRKELNRKDNKLEVEYPQITTKRSDR